MRLHKSISSHFLFFFFDLEDQDAFISEEDVCRQKRKRRDFISISNIILIRKTKSSELAPNENKENCSLPVTSSSNTREKTLTNENLRLDITEHHSSDKSLLIYDLNESTARDLSIITHSPHKVGIVTNEMHCMSTRQAYRD